METNLNPQVGISNNITKNIEPELIGKTTRQELIEREIIFDAPKKDVVLKIVNIQNEIKVKDIKVSNGNILVSGYLNSCIMYTTMKRPQGENNNQEKNNGNSSQSPGYVNTQNSNNENKNNKNKKKEQAKPSCGVVENNIALDGVVRHTSVWISFKSLMIAPEAKEGDICSITSSAVLDDLKSIAVTPIYEEENDEEPTISMMFGEEERKFIKGIVNKTLVEFNAEIKRYPKN